MMVSLARRSDRLAFSDTNRDLSYAELSDAVDSYRHHLLRNGFVAGDRLLIIGEKSCGFLIVMLACLLEGVVYVPVELPMPTARIEKISLDTQAAGVAWTDTDKLIRHKQNSMSFQKSNREDVLIFYTSGTTGTPKGVRIQANNILSIACWAQKTFDIRAHDRIAAYAPWHFDLSIIDIYAGLLSGASIYCVTQALKVFSNKILAWLKHRQISFIYLVPTAIFYLIKGRHWCAESHPAMRCILFAGEPFPLSEVRLLRQLFPNATMANLYGPTETNVCTYKIIPDLIQLSSWDTLPIGVGLPGFELFICNDQIEGELMVAGDLISPGYINDVCADKFSVINNQKFYHTGDIVKRLDDEFTYLRRYDRQIKLFGYRVDLTEIEAYLRSHSNVKIAAVKLVDKRIVAFVVILNPALESKFPDYCNRYLPNSHCPKQFIYLNVMPLTASDKIDYQQLVCEAHNA